MTTRHWDHPKREVRILSRIDYWLDRLEEGEKPDIGDWCREWLNMAISDPDVWGSIIGEGRDLARRVKIDAPEAVDLHRYMDERIEIYAGHIAWKARRELGWSFGKTVATGLDHVAMYGPAGRDIGWGLTPIPRYDD